MYNTGDFQFKHVRTTQKELLFSITPYLDIKKLDEDGKFNKTILNELRDIGEKHDIKPLIREYISSICTVHEKNRVLLKSLTIQWEELIHSKIEAFRSKAGKDESIIGLAAVIYTGNGCYSSPVPIFFELITYRTEFERKNGNLTSLVSRFVTN